MSYILDALQRADAERERGQVPGLQTRSVTLPTDAVASSLGNPTKWAMVVAALALGTLALSWWMWRAPVAMEAPVLAVPVTPVPSVTIVPTPAAVAPRAVAAVTAPPARKPAQPDIRSEPPTLSSKPDAPLGKRGGVGDTASVPGSGSVSPPLMKDLPDALRQQIPALAISGAVYSANPAQRLLLVNGQVLSQGQLAAPDVTLEAIHPTTSEFSFRGTRFRMAH